MKRRISDELTPGLIGHGKLGYAGQVVASEQTEFARDFVSRSRVWIGCRDLVSLGSKLAPDGGHGTVEGGVNGHHTDGLLVAPAIIYEPDGNHLTYSRRGGIANRIDSGLFEVSISANICKSTSRGGHKLLRFQTYFRIEIEVVKVSKL